MLIRLILLFQDGVNENIFFFVVTIKQQGGSQRKAYEAETCEFDSLQQVEVLSGYLDVGVDGLIALNFSLERELRGQ